MKNAVYMLLLLAMASVLFNGCGKSSRDTELLNELKNYKQPPDSDVTTSPEYNFSAFSGTVWKTKVKVALASYKEYTGVHHVYLFVPERFDINQPDYTPLNDMEIIDVLPPGTRVRIVQLVQDNGVGSQLWIKASLLDVTNSEKDVYLDHLLLASNRFIARGPTSSTNWGVNADMLESATNTP